MSAKHGLSVGHLVGGRYRLEGRIGAGGMGQVWRAHDTVLDRPVAIKAVDLESGADSRVSERFTREARTTAGLSHPHVVTVHDSLLEDGHALLVMELLPGPSLAEHLHTGPLPSTAAETVAREVLSALGAAHSRGLVHRDIKPANIVRGGDGRWKVVDFGITRFADDSAEQTQQALTATDTIVGTADYLAPEQALGRPLDRRTDLYALGCVLWAVLAGRAPLVAGTPVATMMRHANEDVPDIAGVRPDVPARMAALIRALTRREPDERPSAAEAALDLLDGRTALDVYDVHDVHDRHEKPDSHRPGEALSTTVLPVESTRVLPAAIDSRVDRRDVPGGPVRHETHGGDGGTGFGEGSRWGTRLVGALLVCVLAVLGWQWWSGHEPSSNTAAQSTPAAAPTPSVVPSASSAPPSPQPPAPSPPSPTVSKPWAAEAVTVAADALGSAVSAAEKMKAIDKVVAKDLQSELKSVASAVRSQAPTKAAEAAGQIRSTFDEAVADGAIGAGSASAMSGLVGALEEAVARWS